MSKMRPQNTGLRQRRSAKQAGDEDVDACELLLAELRVRRARLQELLSLVYRDAARAHPTKRGSAHTHSRRESMGMKQIA
jgi:hypothetical protein